MTPLTVIILTKDESLHIARAIASVKSIATRIIVVDSGSNDDTVALAKSAGAQVLVHPWTTHAAQFNWALKQISDWSGWVLRLDADEIATPDLCAAISAGLPDADGVLINRQIKFMGQLVRFGGVYPVQTLRLFRNGSGRCEDRLMDEHIVVDGPMTQIDAAIIDDNRKPLDWWIAKHNGYASREVIDVIHQRRGSRQSNVHVTTGMAGRKRWIKENLYLRLPIGARAAAYFLYRYVLRGGFRDGRQARAFHVLQGFWYRYLVDQKLAEVERYMRDTDADPDRAFAEVLNVSLPKQQRIAA